MTRLAINDVTVFGGPAFVENTEDGPVTACNYFVGVTLTDGSEYCHPHGFRHPGGANKLAEAVRSAGSIDPTHWTKLEPRMSLEERFDLYAEREDEVRNGLRPEWDMFHGIPA